MKNLELVSEAFSRQAEIFDQYEVGNEILRWMRSVTREHLMRYLRKDSSILELNSGTGLDAVYLANLGFKVHCIDIAEGMINKIREKISAGGLEDKISVQNLSYTNLDQLKTKQFDHIFSNFGGLNCTPDLKSVFSQFHGLLKPNGMVTLVIIPPLCPWELLLALKGNSMVAYRRLNKNGTVANVEGINFHTYYYSVNDTKKTLGEKFKILEIRGLAAFVPPPYMENFPVMFPKVFNLLKFLDKKLSGFFPFNRLADHFIITAQLTGK